jgi:uncharacterized protein
VRVAIRVQPGSSRPGVGGGHDGALVVRVSKRAVDGEATAAALAAVAAKILEVAGADPAVLDALLARQNYPNRGPS